MDVNSLPKTVTRQRHDCDLNPGPSAPKSSTLITRLLSHPCELYPMILTLLRQMHHSHRDIRGILLLLLPLMGSVPG